MRQAAIGARKPSSIYPFLTAVAAVALLAGCQTTGSGGSVGTVASPGGTPSRSVQLIERDVEAPEVFETTSRALWDGRPSLGGIWVAAENVNSPERVIMRNEDNGQFVIGALFRRERLNPGPPLQLSSDAAEALGVLAGSPVTLNVVALRREEEPEPVVVAATPDPVAPEPEPEQQPEEQVVAAEAPVEPVAPAEPEGPATTPVQVLQISARALAEKRAAEAAAQAEAEAAAAAEAAAESAAAPEVTATSLDGGEAAAPEAEAPLPTRRGLSALFGRNPATPEEPAPLPEPADAVESVEPEVSRATPPAEGAAELGDGAFVQVGIFSVEQNARDAAGALSAAGILPTVKRQATGGRETWRVVVGPAPSRADRSAVLRTAQELGFADAYPVQG